MVKQWRVFFRAWIDYPLPEGSFIGCGRYKVLTQIGTGSYGITYLCLDEARQQLVAVKQAKPSKKRISQSMLAWEVEVISKMDHPFIPSFHDYFHENRSWWMVTDYVEGSTIEDLIFAEGQVFGQRDTVEWTLQLMDRVQHVHSKGFVHLDIRIPNVIMKKGELYLIDFGLAQSLSGTYSAGERTRRKVGTRSSKPLKPANIQSDLFDIGHLMLFMLYSQYTPETGGNERNWSEELKLSEQLRQVLFKLLGEHEPYGCSSDFIDDLNGILT